MGARRSTPAEVLDVGCGRVEEDELGLQGMDA